MAPDMPDPPEVRLHERGENGIAAGIFALVDRGAMLRPEAALAMSGTVELRFHEELAPVRIRFGPGGIDVEDLPADGVPAADAVISGSLAHIVQLTSAPMMGGVPKLTSGAGRAALGRLAGGRVRIEGSRLLARRLLQLLQI